MGTLLLTVPIGEQKVSNMKNQNNDQNSGNEKVAFKINSSSGVSYRELGVRLSSTGIPSFMKFGEWLLNLFDPKTGLLKQDKVDWVRVDTIKEKQVRDEKVDTAHAKNLNFTLEGPEEIPLNTPGVGYMDSNDLALVISLHRFYRAKSILNAGWYPLIIIPDEIVREVSIKVIHDACRIDNSVIHQGKPSTLTCDAESIFSAYKQKLLETDDSFKEMSQEEREEYISLVFADKETLREQYKHHWEGLRTLAQQMSCAHGPTEIINQIFKEILRSGFHSYRTGKIDQVKDSLRQRFKNVEQSVFADANNNKFEITLLEGSNQQEQNVLARIPRKRLEEPLLPIYGIICGTGNTKSAVLQGRIRALELFLPLAAKQGFSVVESLINANYGDGFYKYPQFGDGLENQEFRVGNKKYEVTCEPEHDNCQWEFVSTNSVIDFLKDHCKKHPGRLVFSNDETTLSKLVSYCLPKGSTVKEKPSSRRGRKKN